MLSAELGDHPGEREQGFRGKADAAVLETGGVEELLSGVRQFVQDPVDAAQESGAEPVEPQATPTRSNSGTPRSASSRAIARLSEGCATCSSSAAWLRCSRRATAWK